MQQQKAKPAKNQAKLIRNHKPVTRIGAKAKGVSRRAQRQGSHTKETRDPNVPILIPCALLGPDGKERPGWEMRVGEVLFGRADSKESLLQYYSRIHEPMPSGHWRERSWQPQQRVARRSRAEHDEHEEREDEIEAAEW
jgi:hypothetical protein